MVIYVAQLDECQIQLQFQRRQNENINGSRLALSAPGIMSNYVGSVNDCMTLTMFSYSFRWEIFHGFQVFNLDRPSIPWRHLLLLWCRTRLHVHIHPPPPIRDSNIFQPYQKNPALISKHMLRIITIQWLTTSLHSKYQIESKMNDSKISNKLSIHRKKNPNKRNHNWQHNRPAI